MRFDSLCHDNSSSRIHTRRRQHKCCQSRETDCDQSFCLSSRHVSSRRRGNRLTQTVSAAVADAGAAQEPQRQAPEKEVSGKNGSRQRIRLL